MATGPNGWDGFSRPSDEERETIWGIYLKKYGVSGQLPNDEGWTGAEIKECCRKAHRLGITLMQAARYIVPVSRSAAEQIKALRQMASGIPTFSTLLTFLKYSALAT